MQRLLLLSLVLASLASAQKHHVLKATPETVIVGYYDASSKPVLRIQPNDTVKIEALGVGTLETWTGAGLPESKLEAARAAVRASCSEPNKASALAR